MSRDLIDEILCSIGLEKLERENKDLVATEKNQ